MTLYVFVLMMSSNNAFNSIHRLYRQNYAFIPKRLHILISSSPFAFSLLTIFLLFTMNIIIIPLSVLRTELSEILDTFSATAIGNKTIQNGKLV